MSAICRNCPGPLLGDCEDCPSYDDHDDGDYDEEEYGEFDADATLRALHRIAADETKGETK